MKLYELSTQYKQLVDMLENANEDMLELVETINDTLDSITDSIEVKADSIAKMIRELEAEKEMVDSEVKRLADRSNKLEKQKDQLKAYLFQNMQTANMDKIKTALFSFTIRKNAPSVNVIDENLIPQEFIKLTPSIDKRSILERLKNKETIEGCALKQSQTLIIK